MERIDDQLALHHLNPFVQLFFSFTLAHIQRTLGNDFARVYPRIDVVHRRSGDFHAVRQSVPDGVRSGERRQKCWVSVDERAFEPIQETLPEDLHESGGDDHIGVCTRHRLRETDIPLVAVTIHCDNLGADPSSARPVQCRALNVGDDEVYAVAALVINDGLQ